MSQPFTPHETYFRMFEEAPPDAPRPLRPFTPRQKQLLHQLLLGLSNKQIGSNMGIAEGTVKVYLHHLADKIARILDMPTRPTRLQMALWAERTGMIPIQ